ncbi:hypothetical protein SY83_05520 [Paenibacillus swuensis]|uniref:DUF2127 domain-containing protein n=1 Tax=Paenibacillus swuensis TaxID=1178515 RepID=A0A172TGE2_9BACL|nr:hypothetical protein [Paenibacillus swuensis]ANE45853.1 hypothetical protein SY83_05520 [Paenibacillus swuensis]
MKVRNIYYFIAGILALLFAVTHAWNGQSAVLPSLQNHGIMMDTRIVFIYVWHIITAENLVFGIMFIMMSLQSMQSNIRFAAWIFVWLLMVRLLTVVGITAYYDISALTGTLIDSIAIVIYVILIIFGIYTKRKSSGLRGSA